MHTEGERRATQESAKKAKEASKEAEEAKRKLDEELQKKEAERIKSTQQSTSETAAGQTQEVENPEVQTSQIPAANIPMVPTLKLVPFVQEKGKEIPDFNTVYYDRATKRIIKRTERKVEAEGLPGKMITDTAVMLGTDQDPRFTLRAKSAFIQALEDNVGKIITNLD